MPAISSKLIFIYFVLLSSVILTRCREVDDESEFSYDISSNNGPDKWGNIKRDWEICNTGKLQSPVDLLNKRVKVVWNLEKLRTDYKPNNATLLNRGHDMMLRWAGGGGYLNINGTEYELKQCHWHAPSEHKIDGKRFSLEAHLVHETSDGETAVIGILYTIGRPDSFLSMIEKDLKALAETKGVERDIGTIDPKNIKLQGKNYYWYLGSLTVPPCTQGVIWTIDREVKTVTRRQMNLIRDAVHDESNTNARPIQPINNRTIKLYKQKERS